MTYCAVLTPVDSNDILYCISIVVSIVHTTNQYYNIIISQPKVLMTHSVSTNMQYECKIMNNNKYVFTETSVVYLFGCRG